MSDATDTASYEILHGRLLAADHTAWGDLMCLLLPTLVREVSRRFRRSTDEQFIWEGVTDALQDYCARPQEFDPSCGVPLDRFLATAAWRNVSNLLRGETRRKQRERKVARQEEVSVELDPVAGNILQEEAARLFQERQRLLDMLSDPLDRQVLELRLDGVKDTAAYAKVLGIDHLPPEEQEKRVKRVKGRIVVFFRRKGIRI